ncbi:RidA family protein [Aquibacillus saliphilus]|uniref:RidA family protein n=1 Tax=Aquibacillus saliphilus TaxID=1909422 RepID=UPI001CF04EE9|nr:RidA family protein [Aquibacillus saliphilus]
MNSNAKEIFERYKTELNFKPTTPRSDRPYTGVKYFNNCAFISGNVAFSNGEVLYSGRIGDNLSIEEGKKSVVLAVINCLELFDQDKGIENIDSILKMTGYLSCTEAITEHPTILNAASEVLLDIFGEPGRHARAALGMHTLPLNASSEIELIVSVKE